MSDIKREIFLNLILIAFYHGEDVIIYFVFEGFRDLLVYEGERIAERKIKGS